MAEYIERQKLFDALPVVDEDKQISLYGAVADFMIIASSIPTADVVEVVRCKDCVFSRELDKCEKKLYLDNCVGCCFHSKSYHSLIMEDKDFCSCGQKKEGAEE